MGFVYLILSHEGIWQLAFDKSQDLQPVLFWLVCRAVVCGKMPLSSISLRPLEEQTVGLVRSLAALK